MFERRLKVFLGLLSTVILLLMLHGGCAQLAQRDYWKNEANNAMRRPHSVPTSRGAIFDYMGRKLAFDRPCIDACVDYRAIESPPDEKWVLEKAVDRLHAQLGDPYAHSAKRQRQQMREAEIERVKADIANMWTKLAQVSGRSADDIEETRDAVARRVQMLKQYAWYRGYQRAMKKAGAAAPDKSSGWRNWLVNAGAKDAKQDADKFQVTVAEELEEHVILPAIDNDVQNELGKDIDRYPGLKLRPGINRYYPYGDIACHVLGHLARVDRADLAKDREASDPDESRQYLPNDLIGRTGVEGLCEPLLRGSRGRYESLVGDKQIVSSVEPVPGQDVRLSIDIELQQEIQSAFANAQIPTDDTRVEATVLHGAAVVIDVKTGEVRAMVSYPTYDANKLDELYAKLHDDDLNSPLMNRATMAQHEPGSTVKPMVGLAAISEGVLKLDDTIECTGYLVLGGKRYPMGRCWTASKFSSDPTVNVAHHQIPYAAPHPTGFLTFGDALERSCNVFFENCAYRLGPDKLCDWYGRFGLGRHTGIGIAEANGHLLTDGYDRIPKVQRSPALWFSGIGQAFIQATPIQMANVVATIARKGIWMRPTLLASDTRNALAAATTRPADATPAMVDLHIAPAAIAAAWDGMTRVVNGKAGTGTGLIKGDEMLRDLNVAGKTGTAQAGQFQVQERDAIGNIIKDKSGKPIKVFLTPSTHDAPNPQALWYRGVVVKDKLQLDHAWYIGFAPADKPQIAFVAMVEYGGSGGIAAASVARQALEACIAHHYLPTPLLKTASSN